MVVDYEMKTKKVILNTGVKIKSAFIKMGS
jgi:hypothetical protein